MIPCPGSLAATAARHWSAISASVASERSAERRSFSVRANRQLRTWPSAVSRTRSQEPQNGRVTEAITPTRAGPPFTRNVSAGAAPRARCESSESRNAADSESKTSAAVTISALFQPCWASSGICSMNRSSYPRSRHQASSGTASSSLIPRISTALTFTGVSPAAAAAPSPSRTSDSRSRRASLRNTSGRSVSSDTLIRSRPASRSAAARRASPMPLVVSDISGRGLSAEVRSMIDSSSRRSSGSPPVNRTSRMPSISTPIRISRTISSPVRTSGAGSQSRPSGGMQ